MTTVYDKLPTSFRFKYQIFFETQNESFVIEEQFQNMYREHDRYIPFFFCKTSFYLSLTASNGIDYEVKKPNFTFEIISVVYV